MSMKTLLDRRLLVLWLGLAFIGCTLLLSEVGCGQVLNSPTYISATPALEESRPVPLSNLGFNFNQPNQGWGIEVLNDNDKAGPIGTALTSFGTGHVPPAEKLAPAKAPTVWKRDRRRPSFARVYVGDGNSLELVSLHVSVTNIRIASTSA
jgi:hypothetical protein